MAEEQGEDPSYIDYETFLDPSFSPTQFANSLVLATNNTSDTPLDLSTPLSRVLFDVQEIDTHIDSLTTESAVPLLTYTKERSEAGEKILADVETQVKSLTEGYRVLEREVIQRYEAAEQVRLVAERLCETVRLGRAVGRCLMLGRQLEAQMGELSGSAGKKGDHRAMVRCSHSVLSLRQLLDAKAPGEEGHGLEKVEVVTSLRTEIAQPAERSLIAKAQQTVREFSMSTLTANPQSTSVGTTFAQTEDTRSRATSALLTLYLLSPTTPESTMDSFQPKLLITALEEYLKTSLRASLMSLARSLATLPTLDRTLIEISARCQNLIALESLLESIKPPQHPTLQQQLITTTSTSASNTPMNFLQPLLAYLDTSSLPSYFWRSLASDLPPRVQEIMSKGGVSARTLRTNKDRVRDALRQCVDRGSQLPSGITSAKGKTAVSWEREAAVMAGAVMGVLGR